MKRAHITGRNLTIMVTILCIACAAPGWGAEKKGKGKGKGKKLQATASISGVIKEVDQTTGSVTIGVVQIPGAAAPRKKKTKIPTEVTLFVQAATPITLNGTPASLREIIAGDSVSAAYNDESDPLVAINIGVNRITKGIVQSVDTTRGSITINLGQKSESFTVVQTTKVKIGSDYKTLADVRVGNRVGIVSQTTPAGRMALDINIETPPPTPAPQAPQPVN